jgi:Arc/MetJ-type ribon-helix-helix transcriptional regulator
MMNGTERITIRISSQKSALLQAMVDSGEFQNISDVIRTAIDEFLQERSSSDNIQKVRVELPRAKVIELEALIKDGDSVSMDDAIRNAVREYTRTRVAGVLREER